MHTRTGVYPASLRNSTLAQLSAEIPRPRYDRSRTVPSLVHIGVGGFNRSHLAVYLDDLLNLDEDLQNRDEAVRWGEFGIGLLPADKPMQAALTEQDHLYGLLLMDGNEQSYRVIGSLAGYLFARESQQAVLQRLSSPECAIVSMTVTEGGYFIEDSSGRFLADHEEIRHDLEYPQQPRTWLGFVAEAANRRMLNGGGPFTLLSCDNLQGNGETARKALLSFADARGTGLRRWMETNIAFPNSMVDRITPRTTEENRKAIEETFGVLDLCPVVSEPFRQWVLEDSFAAGRPAWQRVGAQMTTDVAPYEKTKMRMLNGGHSAIGYAADLLGHSTIAEAAADPLLQKLLIEFMAEVRPTLQQLPGIDLDDYAATVVKRFLNPALRDQVARICSDGCAKMAKFIVPSLVDLLEAGRGSRVLPLVLGTWLYYLRGHDENGRVLNISDPALESLGPFLDAGADNATLALSVRSLFGELAFHHPQIVSAVQTALDQLRRQGVRAAVTQTLAKAKNS